MQDPFVELCSIRPPTTTIHPNRGIDYVLTYNIMPVSISTLLTNSPSKSDHLGICIDIDIASAFGGPYSSLGFYPIRKLSTKNAWAKEACFSHIISQHNSHNLLDCSTQLFVSAQDVNFSSDQAETLQNIDRQLSKILLGEEQTCPRGDMKRNPWTPQLQLAGKMLSY